METCSSAIVSKKKLIILLPYLGLERNQISGSKRLKSFVSKLYPVVNLKVIFLNISPYGVEHSKRNSISPSNHVLFSIYI